MAPQAAGPQLFQLSCSAVFNTSLPHWDPGWQPQALPSSLHAVHQEEGKRERAEPTISFQGQKVAHISFFHISLPVFWSPGHTYLQRRPRNLFHRAVLWSTKTSITMQKKRTDKRTQWKCLPQGSNHFSSLGNTDLYNSFWVWNSVKWLDSKDFKLEGSSWV